MEFQDDSPERELVLRFDTDHPEFTRGFEAGMIWERMNQRIPTFEQHISGKNAEMIMRMAEVQSYKYVADNLEDGWYWIKFSYVGGV